LYSGYELWRLRLFSFGGYGLALAALALVFFGAYDSYPSARTGLSSPRYILNAAETNLFPLMFMN